MSDQPDAPQPREWENCDGHSHAIPGIWDDDNGDKSGTVCELCRRWSGFPALAKRIAELEAEVEQCHRDIVKVGENRLNETAAGQHILKVEAREQALVDALSRSIEILDMVNQTVDDSSIRAALAKHKGGV